MGSAAVLESLKDSDLFVVPLDPNRDRYRYHHLFRELLRAELERAEPDLVPVLLIRAADWCAANGEPAAAVAYAQRAGDGDRVARLVMAHGQLEYQRGHAVTIEAWLNWLDRHGVLERNPAIASLGAWFSAVRGYSDQAQRWADAAERGSRGNDTDDPTVEAWLALLRAVRCDRGVAQMLADSRRAVRNFGRGSQWWSTAATVRGLSLLVGGDAHAADDLFADIVESALATGAWTRRPYRLPNARQWRSGGVIGSRQGRSPSRPTRSCDAHICRNPAERIGPRRAGPCRNPSARGVTGKRASSSRHSDFVRG